MYIYILFVGTTRECSMRMRAYFNVILPLPRSMEMFASSVHARVHSFVPTSDMVSSSFHVKIQPRLTFGYFLFRFNSSSLVDGPIVPSFRFTLLLAVHTYLHIFLRSLRFCAIAVSVCTNSLHVLQIL